MKKTTERALWIGGSALAAAGLVTVGVLATKGSAAAAPPAPAPAGSASSLTMGHRYKLSVTCPTPIQTPLLTGVTAANVTVTATTPKILSGGTSSASGWDIVFDYTGATMSAGSPASLLGGASACAVTLTDMGLSPIMTGGAQQTGVTLKFSGAYNKVASNTLQPFESYLLEIAPQAGETYATFGQYLAKHGVAPAPMLVVQSFDANQMPKDWPSATTGVWRYVVSYGGAQSSNSGIHYTPPSWTLPPAFNATVWTTQGQTS